MGRAAKRYAPGPAAMSIAFRPEGFGNHSIYFFYTVAKAAENVKDFKGGPPRASAPTFFKERQGFQGDSARCGHRALRIRKAQQ
jgi:hypothetical protein